MPPPNALGLELIARVAKSPSTLAGFHLATSGALGRWLLANEDQIGLATTVACLLADAPNDEVETVIMEVLLRRAGPLVALSRFVLRRRITTALKQVVSSIGWQVTNMPGGTASIPAVLCHIRKHDLEPPCLARAVSSIGQHMHTHLIISGVFAPGLVCWLIHHWPGLITVSRSVEREVLWSNGPDQETSPGGGGPILSYILDDPPSDMIYISRADRVPLTSEEAQDGRLSFATSGRDWDVLPSATRIDLYEFKEDHDRFSCVDRQRYKSLLEQTEQDVKDHPDAIAQGQVRAGKKISEWTSNAHDMAYNVAGKIVQAVMSTKLVPSSRSYRIELSVADSTLGQPFSAYVTRQPSVLKDLTDAQQGDEIGFESSNVREWDRRALPSEASLVQALGGPLASEVLIATNVAAAVCNCGCRADQSLKWSVSEIIRESRNCLQKATAYQILLVTGHALAEAGGADSISRVTELSVSNLAVVTCNTLLLFAVTKSITWNDWFRQVCAAYTGVNWRIGLDDARPGSQSSAGNDLLMWQAGSMLLAPAWLPLDEPMQVAAWGVKRLEGTLSGINHDSAVILNSHASPQRTLEMATADLPEPRGSRFRPELDRTQLTLLGSLLTHVGRSYEYLTLCQTTESFRIVNPSLCYAGRMRAQPSPQCLGQSSHTLDYLQVVWTMNDALKVWPVREAAQRAIYHNHPTVNIFATGSTLAQNLVIGLHHVDGSAQHLVEDSDCCWLCFVAELYKRGAIGILCERPEDRRQLAPTYSSSVLRLSAVPRV